MTPVTDSDAVTACRSLLVRQQVVQQVPWRSTVVPGQAGGWIVRTWTRTPVGDARPSGFPQYVHEVQPDAGSSDGLRVMQVHPIPG